MINYNLTAVIANRPVLSPLSLGNIASNTLIEAEKQNAKQAKAISPQSNLRGKGDSSLSVILDLGSENSSNPGTHLPGPPASSVASSPGAFAQAVRVVSPPAITQSSKSIAPSEQPLVLSVESPRILSRPTSSTPPAAEPNTEPPNCDEPASKRLKLTHIPTSNPTQLDKPPPSMRIPTTGTSTYASSSPTSKRPSEGATRSTCRAIPNVTSKLLPMHSSTGKRFRPLVLDKARLLQSVSQPSSSQASPSMPFRRGEFTLQYLDFPSGMFNTFVFKPITMPPSLSQRSRVRAWAIILSGLSNQERKQCAKVSRMIRYAGTCRTQFMKRVEWIVYSQCTSRHPIFWSNNFLGNVSNELRKTRIKP